MPLIVSDEALASTPGEIQIDPNKFLDYYNVGALKKLYYKPLLKNKTPEELLEKHKDNDIIINWIEKLEHFQFGCVNPAVIINKQKGIIATFTNLANNSTKTVPVIKITRERLELIKNIPLNDGQKIATISLYLSDVDEERDAWIDFEPHMPNCFTDDLAAYQHCYDRVSKQSWQCLQEGLEQIEDLEDEGLYYIELDEGLVNSAY